MRRILILMSFLLFIPISYATTYTCCKNFESDNGTLFSSFGGEWAIDPLNPLTTFGNNSFGVNGSSMWVFGEPTTGASYINKTFSPSIKFKDIRNGNLWIYASNISETQNITIFFIGTVGYANRVISNVDGFNYGWNRFIFNTSGSDFNYIGGFTSDTTVTRIKLKGQKKSTAVNSNITYDELRYNATSRAKAIITFDDGYIGIYSQAYPIMKANNQRGVAFVPITNVGQPNRTTLNQLTELYNNGWDISGHGYAHENLSTLSVPEIATVMNQSYDNLTAWGFTRSNRFFAYPFGAYNSDVINETKKTFWFGVTINKISEPQLRPDLHGSLNNYDGNYYVNRQVLEGNFNALKTQINRTIDFNGTIVIMFHNITSDGDITGAPGTYNDTISNFTLLSNYLASRSGDIDVVTFSDYLNEIPTPPTTSSTNYLSDFAVGFIIIGIIIITIGGLIGSQEVFNNYFMPIFVGLMAIILLLLLLDVVF